MRTLLLTLALLLGLSSSRAADARPPYLDPSQPLDTRIRDLISRMTLPEKSGLMGNDAAPIPRLGIPKYDWWNEALHGVARAGTATVFPQAIGLAATWDDAFIREVASSIGVEARAKYEQAQRENNHERYFGLTFWSPNINIFRDPRWGRGQETYGEDPWLTSRIGVAFVRGLQGDDPKFLQAAACAKHFAVHSGPEPLRHDFDVPVAPQDLYDTYLPAFEALVREAHVEAVMTAYNSVLGQPCAINSTLYDNLYRRWNFDGHVTSDCGAVYDLYKSYKVAHDPAEAEAMAVKAGLCVTCGSEAPALVDAVSRGLISEKEVDVRLYQLLRTWFRLGFFDPQNSVRYTSTPISENDSPAHRALALEAARRSIVLLKNDGLLPLRVEKYRRIAVIGPNANSLPVLLGNYNGTPSAPVTVLDGLKAALGAKAEVDYAKGCDYVGASADWSPVPSTSLRFDRFGALHAEYFSNPNLSGEPTLQRNDRLIELNWRQGNPVPSLPIENFSARWTGQFLTPVRGEYKLRVVVDGGVRLYLGDQWVIDAWTPGEKTREFARTFDENGAVPIRIEFFQAQHPAQISLQWIPPAADAGLHDALALAQRSDLVIFVGGISAQLEGEEMLVKRDGFLGGDRTKIELPEIQEKLLHDLQATGKPIVFVLMSGSAVALPWENDKIPAILEAWYPGQSGGTAVADVLTGKANPSGRLPVTFYRSTADLPAFTDYAMTHRTYRYFEGQPLYAFGHGLSYTHFTYKNFHVVNKGTAAAPQLEASVQIANTGERDGDEVVQLYLQEPDNSPHRSIKSLCAFQRIAIPRGQSRTVVLPVSTNALRRWNTQSRAYEITPGKWEFLIGAASDDIRHRSSLHL